MDELLSDIRQGILDGNAPLVKQKVQAAIDASIPPATIMNDGMVAAMAEVGRLFEEGEYFVPEMLIAARAMKEGLALLRPLLKAADVKPAGRVVACTVRGDLHDIGKNLVCMMLEGAGFEIVDLGVDVAPEKIVETVQSGGIDIVALSALLTTTMPHMADVINQLNAAGLRERVKVMVGGAPVTDAFARQIGADGFAPDASQAANLAKTLVAR